MVSSAVQFLSPKSVAQMFDTTPATVRRWEKQGKIRPVVINGLKRYEVAELLKAAGQALDGRAGRGARSTDPDEALRNCQDAARQDRQARSR